MSLLDDRNPLLYHQSIFSRHFFRARTHARVTYPGIVPIFYRRVLFDVLSWVYVPTEFDGLSRRRFNACINFNGITRARIVRGKFSSYDILMKNYKVLQNLWETFGFFFVFFFYLLFVILKGGSKFFTKSSLFKLLHARELGAKFFLSVSLCFLIIYFC